MKIFKLFILIASIILGINSSVVFAQTSTQSASPSANLTRAEQTLKDKTILEINRRLTSLTNLENRIQGMKKLSDANKNTLVLQVTDQISSLNSLSAKVQSDIDSATLRADRLAVTNQYRIYLLFIPKMQILATGDRIAEIASDMDLLAGKIQLRINQMQLAEANKAIVQQALDNIKNKDIDANTQLKAASDLITPLTPDNGNQTIFASNKQALEEARKKLVIAKQDLASSRQSFDVIKATLNPEFKISTASATPSGTKIK